MKNQRAAAVRNSDRSEGLGFRSLEVRSTTVDTEARTVEAVVASETPVPMYDYWRGEVIPEVLRADGVKLPKQVPLLDSHSRWSMKDQLGSVRDLKIENRSIVGRISFASKAQSEFDMVREGHATDVSAGYTVLKRIFVPKGETRKIGGTDYEGPVNVVTSWKIREVSLTPIGADQAAKLRALREEEEEFREEGDGMLLKEMRDLCESRGMPKDLTDADAQRWAFENVRKLSEPSKEAVEEIRDAGDEFEKRMDELAKRTADSVAKRFEDLARAEAEHKDLVRSLCTLAEVPELADKAVALKTRKEVEEFIVKEKSERAKAFPMGPSVRVTGEGVEHFKRDLGSALTQRALSSSGVSQATIDKTLPADQRAKGADGFQRAGLYQMAEDYVRTAYGVETRNLTRDQVSIVAMFGARQASDILGFEIRSTAAYHTTGSFANLMMDAVNKTLTAGYTEAPSTWRGPMRQGSSVSDFKDVHKVRMGAIPNLPIWPDNKDPETASFSDARETLAVESRSLEVSISYRTLINDDLDALSRIPAQMGNAASRTVNAFAWSKVTGNPTLSDGQPLFSTATGDRKRSNYLANGSTPPSVAAVQELGLLLRKMVGENTREKDAGPDVLNIQPKYLIGPAKLETTINQLVNSAYDPSASLNTMVYNPTRVLTPVIEPLLDFNSETAWYLFADPSQIDTIELIFLQGQETPVIRGWLEPRNLAQVWTVLQTFGGGPLNYRGVAKQNGA